MRSPAFQFYVNDHLGNASVLQMDWAERGMYVHFLCLSWQQDQPGTLPDNDSMLSRWVGVTEKQWPRLKARIFGGWRKEGGVLIHEGLRQVYSKQQAYSETRKQAAEARWGRKNQGNTPALRTDVHTQSIRSALQSSSSLSYIKTKGSSAGPNQLASEYQPADQGKEITADQERRGPHPLPPPTLQGTQKDPLDHLFDTFWEHYPRKEHKDRARQVFKRFNPGLAMLKRMLQAIENACHAEWSHRDKKFIPLAYKWLAGQRWKDE
jgi:uncharacterized protein YdaU (DUF1376 family)